MYAIVSLDSHMCPAGIILDKVFWHELHALPRVLQRASARFGPVEVRAMSTAEWMRWRAL